MCVLQGAFLHRDYLQHYTEALAPGVAAYVDTHRNCEDIAMAFMVANLTRAPPEYVRAPALRDLGQGIFKASPRCLEWRCRVAAHFRTITCM